MGGLRDDHTYVSIVIKHANRVIEDTTGQHSKCCLSFTGMALSLVFPGVCFQFRQTLGLWTPLEEGCGSEGWGYRGWVERANVLTNICRNDLSETMPVVLQTDKQKENSFPFYILEQDGIEQVATFSGNIL